MSRGACALSCHRSWGLGRRRHRLPPTTTSWRRSVEPGRVAGAQQLGGAEREVERLAAVEPRIAHRFVALRQVRVEDLVATAEAFGHVVAGELDVDAAGPRAGIGVRGEEAGDLGQDV